MSASIVSLHHDQPMTTSLAIAEGVEIHHKNVIELIRKHVEHLSEWGGVAFETRPFDTDGGRQWRDVAYLNEPQATLLMTFMRNSPIVIEFKKALVRAFFELRDRVQVEAVPHRGDPLSMAHRADIAVAADRTFRSWMRSCRAAGLTTAQSLIMANAKTREATGIDILEETGVQPVEIPRERTQDDFAMQFLDEWVAGSLDVPFICCAGADLYARYLRWCRWMDAPEGCWPLAHVSFSRVVNLHPDTCIRRKYVRAGGVRSVRSCVIVHADRKPDGETWQSWLGGRIEQFRKAMEVKS